MPNVNDFLSPSPRLLAQCCLCGMADGCSCLNQTELTGKHHENSKYIISIYTARKLVWRIGIQSVWIALSTSWKVIRTRLNKNATFPLRDNSFLICVSWNIGHSVNCFPSIRIGIQLSWSAICLNFCFKTNLFKTVSNRIIYSTRFKVP